MESGLLWEPKITIQGFPNPFQVISTKQEDEGSKELSLPQEARVYDEWVLDCPQPSINHG